MLKSRPVVFQESAGDMEEPPVDQEIREEIRDQVIKQELKQMIRDSLWRTDDTEPTPTVANPSPIPVMRQQKPEEVRKLVDLRPAPPPTFLSPALRKSSDLADDRLRRNNHNNSNYNNNDGGEYQNRAPGARCGSSTGGRAGDTDSCGYNGSSAVVVATHAKVVGGLPPPGPGGVAVFSASKRPVGVSGGSSNSITTEASSQQQPLMSSSCGGGGGSSSRINFGHIDDSVNVKERASRFGTQSKAETPVFSSPTSAAAAAPQPKIRTLSVGSAASVSTTADRKSAVMESDRLLRKFSAPGGGGGAVGSSHAATSPNKIKNMTAIFEQKH
jgi:hypothetical protein